MSVTPQDDRLAALTSWDAPWQGLRAVVAGLGKTGFSIADTLVELGARVIVVAADDGAAAHEAADTLRIVGVQDVRLGAAAAEQLPDFDGAGAELLVTSPGLRPSNPLLQAADAAGVTIWGDVELAWRLRARPGAQRAEWIAITGTNGKTTTTTMTAQILQAAGLKAIPVGNIGTPILDAVRDPHGYDVLVAELSSFQLHWVQSMSPVASVCLNIAEDHLDWHGSMAGYWADKAKVYQNTVRACVYNAEDSETERMVQEADVIDGCRAIGFTTGMPAVSMVGVVEGLIVDRAFIAERANSAAELAAVSDIADLVPRHLAANAAAAAALARAYGVEPAAIKHGLLAYDSGEHRIAPVASRDGVLWVNDSKATNPHAASASLAAFKPVVWIAGGDAKGAHYDELIVAHAGKLKAVVLIGADSSALRGSLARHAPDVPVIDLSTGDTEKDAPSAPGAWAPERMMAEAVEAAARFATDGDTVLLAPAAASIDQFTSYAQRGNAFIQAVAARLDGGGGHETGNSNEE